MNVILQLYSEQLCVVYLQGTVKDVTRCDELLPAYELLRLHGYCDATTVIAQTTQIKVAEL